MAKDSVTTSCELLIIGGSAGSLEVINNLLPQLKEDLSFPIIIVLHRRQSADSLLAELFASKTKLVVTEAEEKEELLPGHVYLAPADYHLLVEKEHTISLDFSEKVNYSRPSIDVTFETAAEAYKTSVVSILLSGASSDGSKGLEAIKKFGGTAIVQDPATAEVAYMPTQAISTVEVDKILMPLELADFINGL